MSDVKPEHLPELLDADGWEGISAKHRIDEWFSTTLVYGVFAVAVVVLMWTPEIFPFVPRGVLLGAVVVLWLVSMILVPLRVRAMKYRLRDDDFVFRRGIIFQRQVAVPYGRLQLIDVSRGPVARILGLSELRLVTASASSGVVIPGIVRDRALGLRDDLVAVAETRRAGL
jgi:membrane protein YdbS with pleckstrin-like domain